MSEITVTRGANVVSHSALVHGAARSLRAYNSTTEWTETGQATLCRPSRRFGRYGAQLTTKAINCANCLHILRKAEAEAYAEQSARGEAILKAGQDEAYWQIVHEGERLASIHPTREAAEAHAEDMAYMYPGATVEPYNEAAAAAEAVAAKPVKLTETQRQMLVGLVAWRLICGQGALVNGGVLVRFSKSNRVATLRSLYNLGLVEQTASGERGQHGTTGSVYVKLTPAGWAAAEAIDADTLATWRAHRAAEIDAEHAEALELNAGRLGRLELTESGKAKVAALTVEYGQIYAWRARHGAGVAVQGGPVGSRTLDRDRIEADHAEALELARSAQRAAFLARHGIKDWPGIGYEIRKAVAADHAEALEIEAGHRAGSITEVYEVLWMALNGDERRVDRVALTAGYTTFGDIPAILATTHLAGPSQADLVRIISARLVRS